MNPSFLEPYQPTLLSHFQLSPSLEDLLQSMIDKDCITLLLLGAPGYGKTSLLRVILSLYYQDSNPNDNILVINKLKEQGQQQYRQEFKVFCQTKSSISGRKKTLVIDDIDILPESIQQIAVYCMDMYPIHFIFTGTSPSKILQSIQSRVFCLSMPQWSPVAIRRFITPILEKEGIDITKEALDTLHHASLKSILHTLEKCYFLKKKITLPVLHSIHLPWASLSTYIESIVEHRVQQAIHTVYALHEDGYSVIDILDHIYQYIKSYSILDTIRYEWVKCLCEYIVQFHQLHEHPIELIFLTHDLYNIRCHHIPTNA